MHSKNAGASLRVTGEGTSATLNGGFQLGGSMSTFEVADGATMTISGIGLTSYGNRNVIGRSGSRNLFLIDNATVTYAPTTAVNLNIGDTDNSSIAGPNTLCVTNNGVLTIPTASNIRCGVSIGQNAVIHDSRIVVCDGGKLESQGGISLGVGQKKSCGGHLLSVDNGTVDILSLSTASVVHDSNSVIRVQGRTGRLIVRSTSTTALNLRASPIVQFVVPPTGFAEVPISVPNGAVANDLEGLYAPIRLEIDARAFARKHAQTSVTLIEAGKDSTAALEELRDNATFVYPANKPWLGGELSVVDGKKLVLTTFAHPGMALIVR